MTGFARVRRDALLVQPELAAIVALGLELADRQLRADGSGLSDDARGLLRAAIDVAEVLEHRPVSVELPIVDAPASDVSGWPGTEEVRRVLGLKSTRRIIQLIEENALTGVPVKGQWRIDPESVQRLAEKRNVS